MNKCAFGAISNEAINGYYDFGAIIGSVKIVDCVINHPSIWAEKSTPTAFDENGYPLKYEKKIYNWVLAKPIIFEHPANNIKGKLRFWESKHDEIICPNCKSIEIAEVEELWPFNSYIHNCKSCAFTIMESEWDRIK